MNDQQTYNADDTHASVPARVGRRPAGQPDPGPALTDMVVELTRTRLALEQLLPQARADARNRLAVGRTGGQTDTNGDAALRLFEVPQGAVGHLMLCAVEMAGVTPASPDTSASLWHAVYAGPSGSATAAQLVQVGNLLDCQPLTPAADAQIPYVYTYGHPNGAPTLRGPSCFWLVIDAATASRQVVASWAVQIEQPDS